MEWLKCNRLVDLVKLDKGCHSWNVSVKRAINSFLYDRSSRPYGQFRHFNGKKIKNAMPTFIRNVYKF